MWHHHDRNTQTRTLSCRSSTGDNSGVRTYLCGCKPPSPMHGTHLHAPDWTDGSKQTTKWDRYTYRNSGILRTMHPWENEETSIPLPRRSPSDQTTLNYSLRRWRSYHSSISGRLQILAAPSGWLLPLPVDLLSKEKEQHPINLQWMENRCLELLQTGDRSWGVVHHTYTIPPIQWRRRILRSKMDLWNTWTKSSQPSQTQC